MDFYKIQNTSHSYHYFHIVEENSEGYVIDIFRDQDGYISQERSFITKELFESCLRTGYIEKVLSKENKTISA